MTTNPELELRLLQFLSGLFAKLRSGRDPEQVTRSALRETADFFGVSSACLAGPENGGRDVEVVFKIGDAEWDAGLLTAFFHDERPRSPRNIVLAPVYRKERKWHVLGLAGESEFHKEAGKSVGRIGRAISEIVQRIDRERIAEVRSRIETKIMEELRPKDLFYQILHGLRTLTGYDHSSALLISGEQADALELVAEQIAWRKGKSDRIGLRIPLTAKQHHMLTAGRVYGFERRDGSWYDWTGNGAAEMAKLLDYNREFDEDNAESGILCATVASRDGVIGVLKVAGRRVGGMGPHEADTLRRLVPQVSVAIQNSRRTETLLGKMRRAERRTAVADIARGVAHDVNNALGSILPLVQQLRADCADGEVDVRVLEEDLEEIEKSVQVCRRIFAGMLAFSRGTPRGPAQADTRRAIDGALAILENSMQRRGIECAMDIPEKLPSLPCGQGDLEQVFLNVLANARDAMPGGGKLTLAVRNLDDGIEAVVEDTGCGISAGDLERIQEPFFTTKAQGNGLGLSICRSILWGMGGEFDIKSEVDEGTRVRIVFPMVAKSVQPEGGV